MNLRVEVRIERLLRGLRWAGHALAETIERESRYRSASRNTQALAKREELSRAGNGKKENRP